MLLTRKLLNQWCLVVKLKSSLRTFYGHHHDLIYIYRISVYKWQRICCVCRNCNPALSSFMAYHPVCKKSSIAGATSAISYCSSSSVIVCSFSFVFRSVCPLNNAFGIFKIFLLDYKGDIFENQSFSWFIYSISYLFLTISIFWMKEKTQHNRKLKRWTPSKTGG